jgi:imidazole glycerol-phosphate synthase subunit HisF
MLMSDKNPYKKGGMFEGASFLLFEKAKQLRNKMTGAEEALWIHLKKGISGHRFRRQHPIGNYIVDFFCYKVKLIIEIDGSVHTNDDIKKNDINKQKDLEKLGYTVIRFTNIEIDKRVEKALDKISEIVNNLIKNKLQKTECKSPL